MHDVARCLAYAEQHFGDHFNQVQVTKEQKWCYAALNIIHQADQQRCCCARVVISISAVASGN